MHVSVVVPIHNEEAVLPEFAERVRPVLDSLEVEYEVICVDDGSTDSSAGVLSELAAAWPRLRVLSLRRNAGHQAALAAGFEAARGDWVVSLDADLQDPPELMPTMLQAALEQGCDVVYGVRVERNSDTPFKRLTADLYYRAMARTAGAPVTRNAGDYRLMSARAVAEVLALPEQRLVYRLLIPYMGFASTTVEYRRAARVAGHSKYPLRKMVSLAAGSYFSFTTAPLRWATWAGVIGFSACIGFSGIAVIAWLQGATVPGWASFALMIGLVGAIQFIFLGLIGEYLARIYTQLQGRPRYFIDREPPPPVLSDDVAPTRPRSPSPQDLPPPPGH